MVYKALADQTKQMTQMLVKLTSFNRNIKIEQLKATFKNPADKRAVDYLVDEEFDWRDFINALSDITQDNKLLDVENHSESFKEFGEFCIRFANMRHRKNTKEVEAYKLANRSQFSWMTEKYYHQGDKESDEC